MPRTALAMAALLAWTGLIGCGSDEILYFDGEGSRFFAPGTIQFPVQIDTFVEVRDGEDTPLPIDVVAPEVVDSPTCQLLAMPACEPTICRFSLRLDASGRCVVRVRATRTNGHQLARCAYHAEHQVASLDDQATIDRLGDEDFAAAEQCNNAL